MIIDQTVTGKQDRMFARARRRVRNAVRVEFAIALCAATLVALVWLAIFERVAFERSQAVAEAWRQSTNLAVAAEQHAINTFEDIEQTLDLVVRDVEQHKRALTLDTLIDHGAIARGLYNLFVVTDESGNFIAGSKPFPAASVADRDYFEFHRTHADPRIFIGKPVIGRVSQRWIIPVTRRINRGDGSFGGIVIASIDPAYFYDFYRKLDVGPEGLISLVGLDGIARATRVGHVVASGMDVRDTSLFTQPRLARSGTLLAPGKTEGLRRYVSYRTLEGVPLVIAVGLSEHDVFNDFRDRRARYYLTGGILTATVVVATLGFIGAARRRRRIEAELLRNEARFRATFDQAAVGISHVDLQGRFLLANGKFCEMHGYTERELQALTFMDITYPDDRHRLEQFIGDVDPAHPDVPKVAFEKRNLRKDGTPIWVSISVALVRDAHGRPDYFATMVQDISEAKHAGEELRESNRRFSDMLANVELVSLMLDSDATVTYCNDYLLQLTGWRREEVIGRNWFDVFIAAEHAHLKQYFTELLSQVAPRRHHENEICTRSGERRLIRWNNSVLRSVDGTVIGTSSIGEDITDRRNAEATRLRNAQLEDSNRLKSEFLASMSHELRTPLNAIIGFAEVIRDGLAGPTNKEQHEYLGHIQTSGEHLLDLINDILDLSKIEAGRMELCIERVSVSGVINAALDIVHERAIARGVRLATEVVLEDDEICLDERKTRQIVLNLLSNAIKFTPAGGAVTLRAVVAGIAGPGATEHDRLLELSVIDTGIGIAAQDLPRLFQPFTQLDGSLSRSHEGTGLGLSLVRHLAELHGGSVAVASELGKGSTFTVWLPRTLRCDACSETCARRPVEPAMEAA